MHSSPGGSGLARCFPYPYKALLAICSDLDETPDASVYLETMRYLNTTQRTGMGQGLGLEVGNSMYFGMPRGQFAYWSADDADRAMVRGLMRSGHIDCLHSFGDLVTTRADAARALDELARHDCRPQVWIDHGTAPSNFGADIMQGSGDDVGSPVYHADLTWDFGVRYVWRGRVTSVIGQDRPCSLAGIAQWRNPAASARTLAKELGKRWLGRFGDIKYEMHATNDVMRPIRLRSGQPVWEFLRSNPHWGGVSSRETADGLAEVLSEAMLTRLVARRGVCILYTHLGKVRRPQEPFGPGSRRALARLARFQDEGKLLVATTRRVLGYCEALRAVRIRSDRRAGKTVLEVSSTSRREDLDGLTIYAPEHGEVAVCINGSVVPDIRRNPPDETGRASVSLPWRALEFPAA